jgi:hypothetical protein
MTAVQVTLATTMVPPKLKLWQPVASAVWHEVKDTVASYKGLTAFELI